MSVASGRLDCDVTTLRLTQIESEKLWRLFSPMAGYLARIAGAKLGFLQAVDGEDVAQEVFVLFARRAICGGLECLDNRRIADIEDEELDQYAPCCRTYLIYITERKCWELHRKIKSQFRVIGHWIDLARMQDSDPADSTLREKRLSDVQRAALTLPTHLYEVLVLRFYAQCSEKEIATKLGVSVRMVKYRLYEIRKKLRALLPPETDEQL
jgi:RNA polymerase sigma factor (sigma-70 family)